MGKEEVADKLSYKTALKRTKLSAPVKWLLKNVKFGFYRLDYGSGKSKDAFLINSLSSYDYCTMYDPYYSPFGSISERHKYHTILCTYVLNVVSAKTQAKIIADIKKRLYKHGKAYFSVRSDIKGTIYSSKGTMQRQIESIKGMKCIHSNSRFKIFEYIKD
jgi:hypothetical protein